MAKVVRTQKPIFLSNYSWEAEEAGWILNGKPTDWDTESISNRSNKNELKSELMNMCNNICPFSFARFPPELFFEIEHFKPKSKFPELTFEWENLFPIYRFFNTKKSTNWDDRLLDPVEEDYLEYFVMNKKLGDTNYCKIELNKNLNDNQIECGNITIKIYGFNDPQMIEARKFWFERVELKIIASPFSEFFK